jgi:hypothetical protein
MLSHISRILGWFWSTIIIGMPKMSVVDPSQPTPEAAPIEPAADIAAPAVAVETPAPAPRGLAAVIADIEGAVTKIKSICLQRTVIDAAETEVRALMASLKAEYETEKAKIEAFF